MNENARYKEKFRLREELAKLRRNKMLDYGQTVKESHQPKVSIDKKKEVEIRQETLQNNRMKVDGDGNFT